MKREYVASPEFERLATARAIVAPCGCMLRFTDSVRHYCLYDYCCTSSCCSDGTLAELSSFGERVPLPGFQGVMRITHQRAASVVSVAYAMAARDRAQERARRHVALASKHKRMARAGRS